MNTNTVMDDFKRELNSVKDTFSKEDAQSWTTIERINEYIKLLLDDELMMKSDNRYSFAERTLAVRHNLLRALCRILAEGEGDEHFKKAKSMFQAIENCSLSIRMTPRHGEMNG